MAANEPAASNGGEKGPEAVEAVQAIDRPDLRSHLERYINFKAAVSFGLTLQASWEAVAISFQSSLLNGGPTAMVYGIILAGFGSTALAASLGEMASIKPVVGAQYRWTSMFAPRVMSPAFWGFLQGWLTVFAWNAACALTPFLMGSLMQGLIIFNNENYTPKGWHTTLLSWASCLLPIVCNIYARRILAPLEIAAALLHILLFIAVIVVLAVMARRSTTDFVFTTTITGLSGWSNAGVQWSIGLLTVTFPLSGFDSVLHMSDEVKRAPKKVPNSMFWSTIINSITSFAFVICLLFCIGDLETVSASSTGYPIFEVLYQATGSKAGTSYIIAMFLVIIAVSNFSIFASVSRLVWAFARDNGLPFPRLFSRVHPQRKMPINALFLVCAISLLLNLIPIGSTVAFTAITSLATVALYISYIPPILLILIRKLEGRPPRYGPWRLGWWGIPINIFAIAYALYIIVFLAFPPTLPVTKETMNYSGPICVGVIIISLLDWGFHGRKRFDLPQRELDM